MGHCVTAIIANLPVIENLLKTYPLVSAELRDGWHLIPLDDEDLDSFGFDYSQIVSGFNYLAPALFELCAEQSRTGPLVYFETDYWGGMGGQQAVAFSNGEAIPPTPMTTRNSINTALRCVGITAGDRLDEFDYMGLGKHRYCSDWKEEVP